MRISDWSSDVCSSDLITLARDIAVAVVDEGDGRGRVVWTVRTILEPEQRARDDVTKERGAWVQRHEAGVERVVEHTEERGDRSEGSRVGKEGVSTGRFRWWPYT